MRWWDPLVSPTSSPGSGGFSEGMGQKWTLVSAVPGGAHLARFWYMVSVKKGVKGHMTCGREGLCPIRA